MIIKLTEVSNTSILIPTVKGILQEDFFEFLEYRCNYAAKVNPNWRNRAASSLRSNTYTIKRHLEHIHNEGWSITEINYSHIKEYLDRLFFDKGWEHKTYNDRLNELSEYYEFLTWKGVLHDVEFPKESSTPYIPNSDFDFLSHTYRKPNTGEVLADRKRTDRKEDFLDVVISMDQFNELCEKLEEIDPVYSAIAITMIQTCLRVSNVCQIPFKSNQLNPEWLLWPEFKLTERKFLHFNHLAKGHQPRKCFVWPSTIQTIYDRYIKTYYRDRKKLFDNVYLQRRNAKLSEREVILPKEILWLNKNGSPIKPYMVQQAFRDIGMGVTPHCLRHTGATHLLYNYCKIHNIEPTEQLATLFHTILQYQLGHKSIETTMHYIRTIMSRQAQLTIPFALPGNKLELDNIMPLQTKAMLDMQIFFEGTSTIINDSFPGFED